MEAVDFLISTIRRVLSKESFPSNDLSAVNSVKSAYSKNASQVGSVKGWSSHVGKSSVNT